jgi:hypothetical protein
LIESPTKPSLVTRPLTIEELPLCLPFGKQFFNEFGLRGVFNPDHFLKTWSSFFWAVPSIVIGLYRNEELIGGMGAIVSPDMFTGDKVATELFWYIGAAHRNGTGALRILRDYEEWGMRQKVDELRISHFKMKNDEQLQRLYEHRGYVLLEQGYQKRLKG